MATEPSGQFCFRARFELGDLAALSSTALEWKLTANGEQPRVVVLPIDPGRDVALPPLTIAEARTFVLRGYGYNSMDEALEAGRVWRSRLMLVFAHNQVGAEFGERSVPTGLFPGDLEDAAARGLRPVPDLLDVVAFECEPAPTFVGRKPGSARGSRPHDKLEASMTKVVESGLVLDPGHRAAYALYAASFSQPSNDARFALLMLAVESLITLEARAANVVEHVDSLIRQTKESGLPRQEIDSLVGSLKWLRRESISRAGKRLAERCPRRFNDSTESGSEFFAKCYDLRSRLFHGNHPIPSRDEIDARASELEVLAGDLIAAMAGLEPETLELVTMRQVPFEDQGQPMFGVTARQPDE